MSLETANVFLVDTSEYVLSLHCPFVESLPAARAVHCTERGTYVRVGTVCILGPRT